MSTIAKKLNITVGSLTTAVNSLVEKGYVDRVPRQRRIDGRICASSGKRGKCISSSRRLS